jgi:hypothetical protein
MVPINLPAHEPIIEPARAQELDHLSVRHLVSPRGDLAEELSPVAVLQTRAHQRAEHTEAPERDVALRLVVHGSWIPKGQPHKRWDRARTPRRPTGTRRSPIAT